MLYVEHTVPKLQKSFKHLHIQFFLILLLSALNLYSCHKNPLITNITIIDFKNCNESGCTVTFPYDPILAQNFTQNSFQKYLVDNGKKSDQLKFAPVTTSLTQICDSGSQFPKSWPLSYVKVNSNFGVFQVNPKPVSTNAQSVQTEQNLPLSPYNPVSASETIAETRSPLMNNNICCQDPVNPNGGACSVDVNGMPLPNQSCQITCTGLYPISPDFTLTLNNPSSLQTQPLELTQTFLVNTAQIVKSNTATCGYNLRSPITTYQRMFDCYAKVINSAGRNDVPYDWVDSLFSHSEDQWFLVYSPTSNPDDRFWLSPVLTSTNVALGDDQQMTQPPFRYQSLSDNILFTGWRMRSITGGRLLWSGVSKDSYNFFEANGKNPLTGDITFARYLYYPFIDNSTLPKNNLSSIAAIEFYLCVPGTPLNQCAWIYKPDPMSTLAPKVDPSFFVPYQNAPNDYSVCSSLYVQADTDPVVFDQQISFNDSTQAYLYEWQMPSYPMLMTLTGENADNVPGTACQATRALPSCNPQGFKAIGKIPEFSASVNKALLSSSVLTSSLTFVFTYKGILLPTSLSPATVDGNPSYVRCVSAAW